MIKLPIDHYLDDIKSRLMSHDVLILTASPGSGKTTRLPPALLDLTDKKILVLEPRRVAATMAAQRIADERQWSLGAEVGYKVRFDNKTGAQTRLIFLTEALLAKQLVSDPELKDVGLIVLDEFHERSIHVDTATALLNELRELARPDLKIVVMSATINTATLQRFWKNSSLLEVQTELHPLELHKDKKAQLLRTTPEWYERLEESISLALQKSPGQKDILAFLPGAGEIERAWEKLQPLAKKFSIDIERMHAQLPLSEQRRILRGPGPRRRVILSTNVAESSVTIDGVNTVVDSGLEKISQLHPRTGFQSLDLVRISLASARQRAGRAARQGPGLAVQMWSVHDELSMLPERPAEIHRSEISDLVLLLSGLGIANPRNLSWYEPPGDGQIRQAEVLLRALGAVAEDGRLTKKGKAMLKLPLATRWSSLSVEAEKRGTRDLGLELSALIQGLPVGRLRTANFLDLFEDWKSERGDFSQAQRILQQLGGRKGKSGDVKMISQLLWQTFPDRLCRRRRKGDPSAQMVGGRGVRLPKEKVDPELVFFLALDLIEMNGNETQVSLYFPLSQSFVEKEVFPQAKERDQVVFDEGQEKFFQEKSLSFLDLALEEPRRSPAKTDVSEALAKYLTENWSRRRERFPSVVDWLERYRYWNLKNGKAEELSVDDLEKIFRWACEGESSLAALEKKDLIPFFANILLGEDERAFEQKVPAFLRTPRGRMAKVIYPVGAPPRTEVRIQDAFGWPESPKIMGEAIVIDLLAPNGRPAQRTQDLASFWRNSYKDVRKDLRARYPKHAWPENPMEPEEE